MNIGASTADWRVILHLCLERTLEYSAPPGTANPLHRTATLIKQTLLLFPNTHLLTHNPALEQCSGSVLFQHIEFNSVH